MRMLNTKKEELMDLDDQKGILRELLKMDPSLEDSSLEEEYRRCYEVWNALGGCYWDDYVLEEVVDAVTWEKKWYWRRKS